MTSTTEIKMTTVTLRCPNMWCRVLNTLQFQPGTLEVVQKCRQCEKEFTYYPTGAAPTQGINCQHPECNKFYPIRPLSKDEDKLYRVMPLGGGQKQYFCNRGCYEAYHTFLRELAAAQKEEDRAARRAAYQLPSVVPELVAA